MRHDRPEMDGRSRQEKLAGSWGAKLPLAGGSEAGWEEGERAVAGQPQRWLQAHAAAPAPPPLAQLQQRLQHWCSDVLAQLSPPPTTPPPLHHQLQAKVQSPLTLSLRRPSSLPVTHALAQRSEAASPAPPAGSSQHPSPSPGQHNHLPSLPILQLLGSFSPWSRPEAPAAPAPRWSPLALLRLPPSFASLSPPLALLTQSPHPAAARAALEPALAPLALPPPPSSFGAASSKAELGRATWTLLHTLAAQLPDQPSRQQQRDSRQLVELITRIYPCGECANHFHEIVKRDPPVVSSGRDFQLWMCRVHNAVNRSLGKPAFNCDFVTSRWSPLDCSDNGNGDAAAPSACAMSIGTRR